MYKLTLLNFLILFTFGCNKTTEEVKDWSYELDGNNKIQTTTSLITDNEIVRCFYFPSGHLKAIARYKNNKINGEQYYFFPNGKLKRKENFRDGIQWGKAYYYYESGVIQYERNWEDGIKVGYCQDYYDISGRIQAINLYNDAGQLFYKKTFDSEGHLLAEEGSKPVIND